MALYGIRATKRVKQKRELKKISMSNNRREEIDRLQAQYQEQSNRDYAELLSNLNSASQDAQESAQERAPRYNSQWLDRQKQQSKISAANAMFTLIGQGIMASAGVDPGRAPEVMNLREKLEKANEDYRYDSKLYSQNRLREAMHRQDLLKDLAKSELAFNKSQADRASREKIASERNDITQQSLEVKERMAERQQESNRELQQMRIDASAALQEDSQAEQVAKEQRNRSQPKEPIMFIKDSNNERLPLYEDEFTALYDDAHWRSLLESYNESRSNSQRENELRRAIQKAYDLRESGDEIIVPLNLPVIEPPVIDNKNRIKKK